MPTAIAGALQSAKDGIGLVVVFHLRVAAVERRPPPRVPEVLVGRVEAPRRGQVDAGGCVLQDAICVKVGTAVNAVSDDAVGSIKAILYPPVVVRRVLHDVARRTLGVDGLKLQIVACTPINGVLILRPAMAAQPHLSSG